MRSGRGKQVKAGGGAVPPAEERQAGVWERIGDFHGCLRGLRVSEFRGVVSGY
jgi:hypothetical protein